MRARFALLPAALLAALALSPDAWATVPGGNLIRNPGAEAGAGSPTGNDFLPIPDWTTTPKFTAVVYGASGFPDAAVAAKIGGGKNFFAGGQDTALSTATQTIDVSGAAAEIDAGRVTASVSAYIGGFSSQDEILHIVGTVGMSFFVGPK